MRAFFSSDDGCYTSNNLAQKLCRSRDQITQESISQLMDTLAPTYPYISDVQTRLEGQDIFPQDAVKMIEEYFRSRTVSTTSDSVSIPYRWLVPANITFNRSLQNRSSYYTDIGVIRLPALLIVLMGLLWGVLIHDRKIIALTGATVLVWIAWMLVADGIVWYGMGMIIWTILAAAAVLAQWITTVHGDEKAKRLVVSVVLIPLT